MNLNMKTKILFILTFLSMALTGCKNPDRFKDVLYFTGTENSPISKYSVNGPTEIGITVTSSCLASQDQEIKIAVDQNKLESFNTEYGKKYKLVPLEDIKLSSNKILLKSGQNVSEPLVLSLLKTEHFEEGVTYCLPLSITSVSDNTSVLETSKTIFVVLEQVVVTKALDLKQSTYYSVPFANNQSLASIPQCSMEARIYVNSFQKYNPYISTVIGIEENFLLRFGDVNIKPNQIQLAGGGYQITGSTMFETNKWYHVAVVYDGNEIRLYINGQLDGSTPAPRGNINLTDPSAGGFHIGYSAGGRLFDGMISEVRVWKKALNANEILNNMCYLSPDNFKDLVAYWRFNDGTKTIKDWSGNGWDLSTNSRLIWNEGVKCPD